MTYRRSISAVVLSLSAILAQATLSTRAVGDPRIALQPIPIESRTEAVQIPGAVTQACTLVLPAGGGPHPAVVWMPGIGKAPRWVFARQADMLARQGVAALICDKRGVGQSLGSHDEATYEDFAADAATAVAFLAARSDIEARRIGLVGYSMGGWLAPLVATKLAPRVAFLVTMAGPAESVPDQQVHWGEYCMRLSGKTFTPEDYAAAKAHATLVQDFVRTRQHWDRLAASTAAARQAPWAECVDLPAGPDDSSILFLRRLVYDPTPYLAQVKVPMFALYGGRDVVVPAEVNAPTLERILKASSNTDFRIETLPTATHDTIVREAWPAAAAWIVQHARLASKSSMRSGGGRARTEPRSRSIQSSH